MVHDACWCTYSVAGKLKVLFLLFAGHIVKNAASLLEQTNHQDQGDATHHPTLPRIQSSQLSCLGT